MIPWLGERSLKSVKRASVVAREEAITIPRFGGMVIRGIISDLRIAVVQSLRSARMSLGLLMLGLLHNVQVV